MGGAVEVWVVEIKFPSGPLRQVYEDKAQAERVCNQAKAKGLDARCWRL